MTADPRAARRPSCRGRGWVRENLARTPLDAALTVVFGAVPGLGGLPGPAVPPRHRRLGDRASQPAAVHGRAVPGRPALAPLGGRLRAGRRARALRGRGRGVAAADPRRAATRRPRRRGPAASVRSGLRRFWPLVLFVVGDAGAHPDAAARGAAGRPGRRRGRDPCASGAGLPGLARWLGVIVGRRRSSSPSRSWSRPAAWAGTTGAACSSRCSSPWRGSCWPSRSGVLAALGRRSSLPAIRVVSVGYIELFRGVPLVAFLFIGQYLVLYAVPDLRRPAQLPRPGAARDRAVRERLHRRDRARRAAVDPRGPGRGGAGAGPRARARRCVASCCPRRCAT